MDYKKLIIINLAFLIITGKIMLYIFSSMQRNLKYIDINKNDKINYLIKYVNEGERNTNLLENVRDDLNNTLLSDYLESSTEELLKQIDLIYLHMQNKNHTLGEDDNLKIIEHINKVKINNHICGKIRKKKLQIFFSIIVTIALVNFLITRKCIFSNFGKIKEKVRKIITKMKKIRIKVPNSISNDEDYNKITSTNHKSPYTESDILNKKHN